MFERLFVWLGGASFVGSLALTAGWYATVLGIERPYSGWRPVVYDCALFSIFALHHSLFARARVKAQLTELVPERLLRSFYVWTASVLLGLVCLFWWPVGGTLYRVTGWPAALSWVVQILGVAVIAGAVRRIDPLELAGIRPSQEGGELQVTGPYRIVRHPIYLGWALIVFGSATMTGDRLVFATVTCLYLAVAIPWEERSLEAAFSQEYEQYKTRVKWKMIPYVF